MRTVPRPRAARPWGPARWLALDCLAAIAYGLTVGTFVLRHPAWLPAPLGLAATVVLSLALAGRRLRPTAALAVVLVVVVATQWPYGGLLPAWSALYLVASTRRRAASLLALAVTLLAPLVSIRTFDRGVLICLVTGLVWAVGYAVGQQRAYERQLLRESAREAQEELAQARRSVTEERMRIARELHDVVAHSMSVITVQAGYGHLVIDQDPRQARAALAAIETSGREALTEMRRLLGVLRADDGNDAAARAPAPGLAELDRLVAQTAGAGVHVELEITGRPRPLSPGIELSAYRIVQEALTNVVKHADVPASHVRIGYEERALTIEVTDDGVARSVPDGAGHGLLGMHERVNLYGGQLEAGPLPGRGFRVLARLPLPEAAA